MKFWLGLPRPAPTENLLFSGGRRGPQQMTLPFLVRNSQVHLHPHIWQNIACPHLGPICMPHHIGLHCCFTPCIICVLFNESIPSFLWSGRADLGPEPLLKRKTTFYLLRLVGWDGGHKRSPLPRLMNPVFRWISGSKGIFGSQLHGLHRGGVGQVLKEFKQFSAIFVTNMFFW